MQMNTLEDLLEDSQDKAQVQEVNIEILEERLRKSNETIEALEEELKQSLHKAGDCNELHENYATISMEFQDLANDSDLQKTIIAKQAATLQKEKTTNTRLRAQLKLLKNEGANNYTEKAEVLKRLAPNYCKTVGIDQGELEDRANLEKRIADQTKEIKELKRQAQEAGEMDSGTNLPAWDRQAKKPRLALTDNDDVVPTEYFSCAEGVGNPLEDGQVQEALPLEDGKVEDQLLTSLLEGDATPTEGMISCKQGVVNAESVKEESEEESVKEESEKESKMEPEEDYAQKSYGCMHRESDDCTHSDDTVALPEYTMGVVRAPAHNAKLERLIALEQQTHFTAGTVEPEG